MRTIIVGLCFMLCILGSLAVDIPLPQCELAKGFQELSPTVSGKLKDLEGVLQDLKNVKLEDFRTSVQAGQTKFKEIDATLGTTKQSLVNQQGAIDEKKTKAVDFQQKVQLKAAILPQYAAGDPSVQNLKTLSDNLVKVTGDAKTDVTQIMEKIDNTISIIPSIKTDLRDVDGLIGMAKVLIGSVDNLVTRIGQTIETMNLAAKTMSDTCDTQKISEQVKQVIKQASQAVETATKSPEAGLKEVPGAVASGVKKVAKKIAKKIKFW